MAAYGLDSISCGSTIAFAMECFERGLLTPADTAGLNLRFGNGDAMLEMVERIALRQGLGHLLGEGVARASKIIGRGTEEFALHVKGQEIPMHEPRWKQGMGVGYAISPTGADHCHNIHDSNYTGMGMLMEDLQSLGVVEPLPVDDLSSAKMRLLAYQSLWIHFMNCGVCCYFVMMYGGVGFQRTADLVSTVTGWNTSVFELMKVGERAATLARVFNIREGLSPLDDTLPRRFFFAQSQGSLEGVAPTPDAVRYARDSYYDIMGWPHGRPSPGKLAELGLDWVTPVLEGK